MCWGSNAGAQLGDGSNLNDSNRKIIQARPILVKGVHAGAASVTVSSDRTHVIMANGIAPRLALSYIVFDTPILMLQGHFIAGATT